VKFWACAGIVVAPRKVWAFEANAPASKIAVVAVKMTISLRMIVSRMFPIGGEEALFLGQGRLNITVG
jgi:hypothetical protein